MAASCDLNVAKKNLTEALGDAMKLYLQNLKSWFKQKISKEDFDLEARKLLKSDSVHLHNEFLLAIISKCQSLSSSLVPRDIPIGLSTPTQTKLLKKGKLKKKLPSSRTQFQRFAPVNPLTYAPIATYRGVEDAGTGFASRELTLPDVSMVHGRMIVCAWEHGLDDVSDRGVSLVMQALEQQLKTIISTVLSRKNGYKLREKRFRFAMGTQVPNPYLRQSALLRDNRIESKATTISPSGSHIPSMKSPVDVGEEKAAQQLSTSSEAPPTKGLINIYDLLDALQLYKSAVPSHSVYAPAVERAIDKLWHPSNEDIEQELIHKQEVAIRQQLASHHAVVR